MPRLVALIAAAFIALLTAGHAAAQTAMWPDLAPDRFIMAHVDVETTGLDPAYHEIIDAGFVYTDLEGRELGRLHLRIMPPHPERISPASAAVNGFDVALWRRRGAISETEAVRRFREFHERTRAGRTVLFTAYNAWFDQGFTAAMLARHGVIWRDLFHYHVLDIPSMAWAFGMRELRGTSLSAQLGLADETRVPTEHTGATGADFNVAIYRALLARRQAAMEQHP